MKPTSRSNIVPTITAILLSLSTLAHATTPMPTPRITGELKKWHKITITFDGPVNTSETATPNPFRDYRLNVTFNSPSGKAYIVPGYYAADGMAAKFGSSSGMTWRVHFMPNQQGKWHYAASFRTGKDVALSADPSAGQSAGRHDRWTDTFEVRPTDKTGRDHRATGLLRYVGKHHLQFAETREYFLKGGADSPENFLAYADFDGTPPKHHYKPHARDFEPGDPTWQDGKGKNIIGALSYLASKGMNSVYFLTMNVAGDGKDVWPWTDKDERYRFDCSKLDQWEIVFEHMDKLGLMLHVITQENENDQLLDGGELGPQRKLYYRELIARFSHHPAIVWNLGEENTNTDKQRKAFAEYFHKLDPYDHPVVVHTYPPAKDKVYAPLLGFEHFEGASLQISRMRNTHAQTIEWLDKSAKANRKWFVCLDEFGPANAGVKPDADDPTHDQVRTQALWGNLMAGGAGCEWYFGYRFAHNDLNCEDWRSRDKMWDQTRYALEFFQKYLPFTEMTHKDELTSNPKDYCLAKPGEIYAIYLPTGGTTNLNLGTSTKTFTIRWYNPRKGGPLQPGTIKTVTGPGSVSIGQPPADPDADWAALVLPIQVDQ